MAVGNVLPRLSPAPGGQRAPQRSLPHLRVVATSLPPEATRRRSRRRRSRGAASPPRRTLRTQGPGLGTSHGQAAKGRQRRHRYEHLARDAEGEQLPDAVERRANAFAVEFLAPRDAVKQLIPDVAEVSAAGIAQVMANFGIGRAAARYHVWNAWWRQAILPPESSIRARPADEQRSAEDFTLDYFPIPGVTDQRRGRFALLTAEAVDAGLITADTAAQHLSCTEAEVVDALPLLLELG